MTPDFDDSDKPMVELVKVTKVYPPDVVALQDVSATVDKGEMVFLTGMSGAGKTTMLKLICRLEAPTSGVVEVSGRDLSHVSSGGLQQMRQKIGVAYQDFKLLPKLTAMENIAMAMEVAYQKPSVIRERVMELLEVLGLAGKYNKPAGKLSRGEQQRVSIARAAANAPPLLLADEPTGNLDPASSQLVMELFKKLNGEGTTIIIATHDQCIYRDPDYRHLDLQNGLLSIAHVPNLRTKNCTLDASPDQTFYPSPNVEYSTGENYESY